MTDLFREVDDEVRRDKAADFWKKYQNFIYGGAALILAGVAGWQLWQHNQQKQAAEAGGRFEAAMTLAREDKHKEAAESFEKLASDAPSGYSQLARLRAAAELSSIDAAAAVKAYDALAADSGLGPTLQELAKVRAAHLLIDAAPYKDLQARVETLAAGGGAWRNAAREILGLSAFKHSDFDAAGRWLDQLIIDKETPRGMRQRAELLMELIRGAASKG